MDSNDSIPSDILHALYGSSACVRDRSVPCVMSNIIWRYCTPLLILTGVVGNSVSLVIWSRRNLRRSKISIYLIALSVSDLVSLLTVYLNQWIISLGFSSLSETSNLGCKLSMWSYYAPTGVSLALTSCLALARVVGIKFPIPAKKYITFRTTKYVATFACIVWPLLSSHILIGFSLVDPPANSSAPLKCVTISEGYSYFHYTVWPMISNCVFAVAVVLLLLSNTTIGHALIKRRWRSSHMNSSTELVFAICVFFCLCCTPAMVFLMVRTSFTSEMVRHNFATYKLIYAVVSNLLCINFVFNFVFYGLLGRLFRQELCKLWAQCQGRVIGCRPTPPRPSRTLINDSDREFRTIEDMENNETTPI